MPFAERSWALVRRCWIGKGMMSGSTADAVTHMDFSTDYILPSRYTGDSDSTNVVS